MTVPVMIQIPIDTFKALEKISDRKGVSMRDLIVAGLVRSTQPRPERVAGQIASATRAGGSRGYRRLDDAEWTELKRLRSLGWTVPELAVRYGCSSSSIYLRTRREARA